MIGQRIQQAISALGISEAMVASQAGVLPIRLGDIIRGAVPSTRELAAIAEAIGVDPASLFRGDIAGDHSRSVARFRAPQGITQLSVADTRLLSRAAEAGRICAHLAATLGKGSSRLNALRVVKGVRSNPEPWQQGYLLGAAARQSLAPAQKQLESVQQLLEDAGVHVAVVAFSTSDIEAAALFERGAYPVILQNRKNRRTQLPLSRRAILAHELCHILHDGGERDLTVVSRDSSRDPIEQRANGFAPNFLVPSEWLAPKSKIPRKIVREIAESWGLSFEGAAWHAKHKGLISAEQAERLAHAPEDVPVNCEAALPRTPPEQLGLEGVKVSPLAEGLLSELVLLARLEGVITKGRAAEILTLR